MSSGFNHYPLELVAFVDTNNDSRKGPEDLQIGSPVTLPLVCPEPPPPAEVVDELPASEPPTAAQVVDDLLASAALSEETASSLSTRLDAAAAQADQGRIKTAVGLLKGARAQVEGLVSAGRLDAAAGQALLDALQREINLLRK